MSLGTEFRRSVLEKNGNEAVGAVVMMRHGENPLEVTKRIKAKIQELQPGLPEGVRIVPFYDRTRLIHGAIEMITETLLHEMIIASVAILLILMHFRSALLICMTLPLAVLVSFILMRHFNIPSNIMSLSGIAISIGILVDQAIVMVENATHHLTAHFGHDQKITGDTREIVIPACRMVGRPIFFSVMIILLSFIPGVRPDRAGGQDVPSAGLHQELRHDRRGDLLDHAGAGPDPQLHQGPAAERGGKLAGAEPDRHLQALAHLADAAAEPGDVGVLGAVDPRGRPVPAQRHRAHPLALVLTWPWWRSRWRSRVIFIAGAQWQVLSFVTLAALALCGLQLSQDRHGLHAAAGRREHSGHAGDGAAGVGDPGRRRPQGPRRPAAAVSRGGNDRGQGGPGRHAHRSFAAGHGGEHHHAASQGALAQAEARLQGRREADGRGAGGPAAARSDRADRRTSRNAARCSIRRR